MIVCSTTGMARLKKKNKPSVSVQYDGACFSLEVDKRRILFMLSLIFCLSQLKQPMNKYGKVAIPDNGHHPKVCCSARRALRCMRDIFSTTVAAGFAIRFRFNIIPPKDSNPNELYHRVTVFSVSAFIFIFCCVINLLFLQIEIFYLQI
jgi:hypothetical protein